MSNPRRTRLRLETLESRLAPAAGGVDQSFAAGLSLVGLNLGGSRNDSTAAIAVQRTTGRVAVAGTAQVDAVNTDFLVTVYKRDGSLDTTFNGTGKHTVLFDLNNTRIDAATAVAFDAKGRIVVAGYAHNGGNGLDFAVCRLLPTGQLDSTFGRNGKVTVGFTAGRDDQCFALAFDPDGKIVLAGRATQASGTDIAVCRLMPDGSLDPTFDGDGQRTINFGDVGSIDEARAIVRQPDGKYLLAGTTDAAGDQDFAVCRILPTGPMDPTFDGDGQQIIVFDLGNGTDNDVCTGMVRQADGKIILAGTGMNTRGDDFVACRLLPDGTPDVSFGGDARISLALDRGGATNDRVAGVRVQPDGKVILGGTSDGAANTDIVVARFNADGTPDATFGTFGAATVSLNKGGTNNDAAGALALTGDGILVAGTVATAANGTDVALLRLIRDPWVVVSADAGGPPTVGIYTPTGTLLKSFNAYPAGFLGGVRVAAADITGDGVPELFCVPGPTGSPVVRIFDGATLRLLRQFAVYGPTFKLGVNLTVGDVLGDGTPELVVAPDVGGAPYVNVYDVRTGAQLRSVLVYGKAFTRGVRVTTAQVAGDARREVVVAPQAGGAPVVNILDLQTGQRVSQVQAFAASFTLGLHVAAGNFDASPDDEIVVGAGGGASVARVFKATGSGTQLGEYTFFGSGAAYGARVAALDVDRDGKADVVASPGAGGPPGVEVAKGGGAGMLADFDVFTAAMTAGLFVLGVPR